MGYEPAVVNGRTFRDERGEGRGGEARGSGMLFRFLEVGHLLFPGKGAVRLPSSHPSRVGIEDMLPVPCPLHEEAVVPFQLFPAQVVSFQFCPADGGILQDAPGHLRQGKVIVGILQRARCLLVLVVRLVDAVFQRDVAIGQVGRQGTSSHAVAVVGVGGGLFEGIPTGTLVGLETVEIA